MTFRDPSPPPKLNARLTDAELIEQLLFAAGWAEGATSAKSGRAWGAYLASVKAEVLRRMQKGKQDAG